MHFVNKAFEMKVDFSQKTPKTQAGEYPVRNVRVHEQTLRYEGDRLCKIGVLRKINRFEWESRTFIIPKKNGTVRCIHVQKNESFCVQAWRERELQM